MRPFLISAYLLLAATASTATAANPQFSKKLDAAFPQYRLEVLKPGNDETFINTANQITVQIKLEPELQAGHSIWIYLDGERVAGLPTDSDTFILNDVWRGAHTLSAAVMSGDKQLIGSRPVAFYVRQTSTISPAGTNLNASAKAANKAKCVAAAKAKGRQPTYAEVQGRCDAATDTGNNQSDDPTEDPAKCVADAKAAGRQPTVWAVKGRCSKQKKP